MINASYESRSIGTFGSVMIAGAFAATMNSLPSNAQSEISEQCSKNILSDIYCGSADTPTYSYSKTFFVSKYDFFTTKFEQSWLTPELSDFLLNSSQVSLEAMVYLLSRIRETYGSVQVNAILHTDPEEDWVKPVFIVHSGIEDFDELLDVEDSFFAKATNDSTLLAILPFVIVSQA